MDGLPPPNVLAEVYTPAFWGIMIESVFTGFNILLLYGFLTSGRKDEWYFRLSIAFMVCLDIMGTLITTAELKYNLIDGYGNQENLYMFTHYFFLENICNILLTVMAQAFIGRQIFILNRRWWPATLVMGVLIVAEVGLGIFIAVHSASALSLTALANAKFTIIAGLWHALACVCDVIATVSLCIIFHASRTGFRSTNHLIDAILVNILSRGILLTVVQLLLVVLWYTQNTKLTWIPFFFLSGKVYISTLLALLNWRAGYTGHKPDISDITTDTHMSWRRGASESQNYTTSRMTRSTNSHLPITSSVQVQSAVETFGDRSEQSGNFTLETCKSGHGL